MAFLAAPAERYRESFFQALREFQAEGRTGEPSPEQIEPRFASFVQRLLDRADRTKIEPGLVLNSIFWLVEGDIYIGRISIRHELNASLRQIGGHIGYVIRPSYRRRGYGTLMLKYGLEQARALSLSCVLLTCDEDNIGSRKIIEANGGMLEDISEVEGWPVKVCRYWIQL